MSWDRRAIILAGLGYGDEGKGTWTDFLARTEPVHTVVRFNGGAQAGHNVVTADGRHHTFAQFGSGTLVPGVNTHLSRFMLLNPIRLLREADELQALGIGAALDRLSIDRRALVTTPFQVAANRLRELGRGDARHGSCGMGIGETMADWLEHGARMLTAGDLADASTVRRKLREVRAIKRAQLADLLALLPETDAVTGERRILFDDDVLEVTARSFTWLGAHVRLVGDGYLGELLGLAGTVVFEGAQGALLDEWHGFHPYTTWSTTTFKHALTLLDEQQYDGETLKIGLLRAYMSRHGAGPFVTEDPGARETFSDPYNVRNDWQQGFRVGPFDAVAARYAIEIGGRPDLLAVSHLDQIAGVPEARLAMAYRLPGDALAAGSDAVGASADSPGIGRFVEVQDGLVVRLRPSPAAEDLAYQERLTEIVARCEPVYRAVPSDADRFLDAVEDALGVPIGLASSGPTADDKWLRVTP
jgi:adenylosuccinate synthase